MTPAQGGSPAVHPRLAIGSRPVLGSRPVIGLRHQSAAAGECGSAAVELTLVTPLIILLVVFVVACGRVVESGIRVDDAAHQAARAASLARDPATARQAALTAAAEALPDGGASCRARRVVVDTTTFRAGGQVSVVVSCAITMTDLTGLPLPAGAGVQTGSFTSPIDPFRGATTTTGAS